MQNLSFCNGLLFPGSEACRVSQYLSLSLSLSLSLQRKGQEGPAGPRKAQGGKGKPRKPQEGAGRQRMTQEGPGRSKEAQKGPGRDRKTLRPGPPPISHLQLQGLSSHVPRPNSDCLPLTLHHFPSQTCRHP